MGTTVNGLTIHVLKSPYTTVAANRNVLTTTQNGTKNLTVPALGLLLGQGLSKADVGAHITGSGIPTGATIASVTDVSHAQLSVNRTNSNTASRSIVPDCSRNRFPDVVHIGPLPTLHRSTPTLPSYPNAPYNNWSETNRPTMYTPIDPNQFYFRVRSRRESSTAGIATSTCHRSPRRSSTHCSVPIYDPGRAAALQGAGAKNRHPLVVTYPRFDANPVTGAPATNPATGQPSFDPESRRWPSTPVAPTTEPRHVLPSQDPRGGTGGIYPDTSGGATGPIAVYGSVVDGSYFNAATNKPEGNTSDLPDATGGAPYDPSLFAEPTRHSGDFVVFQLAAGAPR